MARRGHLAHQRQRDIQRDLKSVQVAVVNADQRRFELQGARQFRLVMHLDQHRHIQRHRQRLESLHLRVIQAGGNQQNTVSAHDAGFIDLVGVDDEILAQHRQAARGARLLQVVNAALKKLLVGQHRQAGRAELGIALGDVCGNEVGAQHALGRTRLLDFGNHGWVASRDFGAQRTDKIPRVHARLGVLAHGGQRLAADGFGDFLALDGNDFVQNVTHGVPVGLARAAAWPALRVGWTAQLSRFSEFSQRCGA